MKELRFPLARVRVLVSPQAGGEDLRHTSRSRLVISRESLQLDHWVIPLTNVVVGPGGSIHVTVADSTVRLRAESLIERGVVDPQASLVLSALVDAVKRGTEREVQSAVRRIRVVRYAHALLLAGLLVTCGTVPVTLLHFDPVSPRTLIILGITAFLLIAACSAAWFGICKRAADQASCQCRRNAGRPLGSI